MKQLTSLVWKEWREARAYLWIGLGVFLGLPLIGGLEYSIQTSRHFYIETSGWVGYFGGVLAVFVAVGGTCRDLSGGVEDFWRSVPVSVARWLSIKYFVGMAIVLLACVIPVLVDTGIARQSDLFVFIASFSLFFVAVYSLAFAAGCLLRRTAHAAMVGLAGMLLIWFLPLVLPPLSWMSFTDLNGRGFRELLGSRQAAFAAGMLALAAAGIVLAILAVRRNWHIESGRRMIYGCISAAFLILCASASFQLGTNLPVLQQIEIPNADHIRNIFVDGTAGGLEAWRNITYRDPQTNGLLHGTARSSRRFEFGSSGVQLGPPFDLKGDDVWFAGPRDATLPDRSFVNYGVGTDYGQGIGPLKLTIFHYSSEGQKLSEETPSVPLWNLDRQSLGGTFDYAWKDRLYVIGTSWQGPNHVWTDTYSAARLAVLDISDPLKPKPLSNGPFDCRFVRYWSGYLSQHPAADTLTASLAPLPGLPARERLRFTLGDTVSGLEGDTFCIESGWSIVEYHLQALTDRSATFTKIGEYKPNLLQQVFGAYDMRQLKLQNGLLYAMQEYSLGDSALRPLLTVFDTRGPHPMRVVGHFAAPEAWLVCPLPDGRALVGGSKLWLVGPPPNVGR